MMDFLDVANAVYYRAGYEVELNEEARKINDLFKKRNKTVFILIDGMGALVLNNLLPESFLNENVKEVATTIFPSTTSVVLTALATGKYPTTHAINGWFSYIEETDESIIPLPFINRFDAKAKLKTDFNDVFCLDTCMDKIPGRVSMIANSNIINSNFSTWSRGNTKGYGYRTLKGAFQTLSRLLTKDNEKEYIYLYMDEFDSTCHKYGPDSEEARLVLNKIDMFIKKYAKMFFGKANTVIIADHGQVRIKEENFFTINSKDKIMELLKTPPSGDSRSICFHVKDGKQEEFVRVFNERYGEYAKLMSIEELDKNHIFGPEPMSKKAKMRFGDFCAHFKKDYAFSFVDDDFDRRKLNKGCHSGNSDEEMKIPVIIIN